MRISDWSRRVLFRSQAFGVEEHPFAARPLAHFPRGFPSVGRIGVAHLVGEFAELRAVARGAGHAVAPVLLRSATTSQNGRSEPRLLLKKLPCRGAAPSARVRPMADCIHSSGTSGSSAQQRPNPARMT